MSAIVFWFLIGLPALAGAVLCMGGRRLDRAAVPVSLAVSAVVAALAIGTAFSRPTATMPFVQGAAFGLTVDALSAVVLPAVASVALVVLVFASAKGAAREISPPARFHGFMLLFTAAVLTTVTATTLVTLLFAWELMGAMSYALIGFRWSEQQRVSGGLTAFLVTRSADLGLYAAAGAALAAGTGMELTALPDAPPGWRDLIAAGILIAALGKAAQLPFSFWLSRAMEGPSPVSALLHSAAMVAMGGYLLLRTEQLLEVTGWAAHTAAWTGALTALGLGAVAVAQRDLKQLLAASTAAQLGFVVLAAGLGATAGGTAHLVAHAATKAALFLAAGAWLTALGTKQLGALRGAGRRWPLVGVTFAVAALSLAGVAPLSLWATKDAVLAVALEESLALYGVGLAAALVSAAYAGKILIMVWRPMAANTEDQYDTEEHGTRHIGRWEKAPLVVLAMAAAVLGALALPPLGDLLRTALNREPVPESGLIELAVSTVLAVIVIVLVARFRTPEPCWASDWLGLERAAHLLVMRPVVGLAGLLARFDDRVIDRGVWASARLTEAAAKRTAGVDDAVLDNAVNRISIAGLRAADVSARTDAEGVDAAVEATARAARRFGSLARRPQTGQLHHYYAQAVVVLAAAVVLLLLVR